MLPGAKCHERCQGDAYSECYSGRGLRRRVYKHICQRAQATRTTTGVRARKTGPHQQDLGDHDTWTPSICRVVLQYGVHASVLIGVGGSDGFYDEDHTYAERLRAAEVKVTCEGAGNMRRAILHAPAITSLAHRRGCGRARGAQRGNAHERAT